jgi:predicted DNA-binding transcriptional regulator YafY
VYHPTTRVLTVLELLQSHSTLTGAEIARRLEVDTRTVRRYIAMLEELGIPVTTDRGRYGGYRLMPGFKLPPLMFNEDEALALMLGLRAARRLGLAGQARGVEGAQAKLERALPERVRHRVRALEETLVWDMGERTGIAPDANVVLTLSTAAQERRRVALRYRRTDQDETERRFDPYGLVCRWGRWYAIGQCHLRGGQRLLRLDRIAAVTVQNDTFERPPSFDVLAAVLTSLGSVPRHYPLDVTLETTIEEARRCISEDVATLEESAGGGVLLRGYTDNPDFIARLLARLGCRFTIRQPPELREALRRHASQISQWAAEGAS